MPPLTLGRQAEKLVRIQQDLMKDEPRFTPILGFAPTAVARAQQDTGLFVQAGELPFGIGDAVSSIPIVGGFLGDVPIGMNIGTEVLGLEGTEGFIADLLLDPFNFISGVGFLKGARSAKAAARLVGRSQADTISAMAKAGFTSDEIITRWASSANRAALFDKEGFELLKGVTHTSDDASSILQEIQKLKASDDLNQTFRLPETQDMSRLEKALAQGRVDEARRFVDEQIGEREELLDLVRQLAFQTSDPEAALSRTARRRFRAGATGVADPRVIRDIGKRIKKLRPSKRNRLIFSKDTQDGLKLLIERERMGLSTPRLPAGAAGEGVRARQAALRFPTIGGGLSVAGKAKNLIEVGIPLTDIKFPVITGQPIWQVVDKLDEVSGGAFRRFGGDAGLVSGLGVPVAKIDKVLKSNPPEADANTVSSMFRTARELIKGIPTKVDDASGLQDVVLGERSLSVQTARMVRMEVQTAIKNIAKSQAARGLGRVARLKRQVNRILIEMVDNPGKFFEGLDVVKPTLSGPRRKLGDATLKTEFQGKVDPEIINLANAIDEGLADIGQQMLDLGLIENMIEDYFPRIVRVINEKKWQEAIGNMASKSAVTGFYRFGLDRKIPHFDQLLALEAQGVVRVNKNPSEILEQYIEATSKAISDSKFVERAGRTRVNIEALDHAVHPGVFAIDEARQFKDLVESGEYVIEKGPAFTRVGAHDGQKLTRPWERGVYVHKSIRRDLFNILDSGFDLNKLEGDGFPKSAMRAALVWNSIRKRALLAASSFHMIALTESTMASLGPTKGGLAIQALTGRFNRPFFGEDLVRKATESGLNMGSLDRQDLSLFNQTLESAADKLKGKGFGPGGALLQKPVDALRAWDTLMWQNQFAGIKLMGWHELYLRGLQQMPGTPSHVLAKAAADHMNNAIGGLNWEKFWMGSRSGQQLARLLLLAPDWTTANLRIAWDVFANMLFRGANVFGGIVGSLRRSGADDLRKIVETRASVKGFFQTLTGGSRIRFGDIMVADARARFARRYAFNAAIMSIVGQNMLSYALNGHPLEDNPAGRRDMLKLPWGEDVFFDFGKQFREPFKWLEGPLESLRFKKSTILDNTVAIFGGVDIFGRPIASHELFGIDGTKKEDGPLASIAKQGQYMLSGFVPISWRSTLRAATAAKAPELVPFALAGVPVRFGVPPAETDAASAIPEAQSLDLSSRLALPRFTTTQGFRRDFATASQPLPF